MFANEGCYLEVVPNENLIWTSALLPGYRPQLPSDDPGGFPFTAVITMVPRWDSPMAEGRRSIN